VAAACSARDRQLCEVCAGGGERASATPPEDSKRHAVSVTVAIICVDLFGLTIVVGSVAMVERVEVKVPITCQNAISFWISLDRELALRIFA
jgi:hypothetical protein